MDFSVISDNLPFLAAGLRTTLVISALTIIGGTALGLALGLARYLALPALGQVAAMFIEIMRGTPLLVVLLMCYFAIPALLGYQATAFGAALLGFTLFIGAYLAEDIRGGLTSVRRGLINAALATGLTRLQVLRLIILPQAIRRIIPTLFNQYVRLFKFTSVASVIGVTELTGGALLVNAREFQPIPILATVALTYLVCCYALSSVGRMIYTRVAVRS